MEELIQEYIKDGSNNTTEEKNYATVYPKEQNLYIAPSKLKHFWAEYCSAVKNGEEIYLTEKVPKLCPVTFTFTFKFYDEDESYYTENFIHAVIKVLQSAIKNFFVIDDDGQEYYCCVLESEDVTEIVENDQKINMTQLRFQFPYCKAEPNYQKTVMLPSIIKNLITSKCKDLLCHNSIGDWKDIIECPTLKSNLLLYGSKQDANHKRFTFLDAYVCLTDVVEITESEKVDLEQVFKIKNIKDVIYGYIEEGFFQDQDLEHWIPIFLSVNYSVKVSNKRESDKSKDSKGKTVFKYDTGLDKLIGLLPLLSEERFIEETTMLEIGRAIHHEFKGNSVGFDLWCKHTLEKNKKITTEELEKHYDGIQTSQYTVRTIAWYARIDSPSKYDEWQIEWLRQCIDEVIKCDCKPYDVAKTLYIRYWLEFIAIYRKGKTVLDWFEFKSHHWEWTGVGINLKKHISIELLELFELARVKKTNDTVDNDEGTKRDADLHLKIINKVVGKLKDTKFKGDIMKEVIEFFHEDSVTFDTNSYILGIKNGVIELGKERAIFRDGKPEDYIKKYSNIKYKNYSLNHPFMREMDDWLDKMFPDKELKCYFEKYCASLLVGKTDKKFNVWTGNTNNAKSTFVKLLGLILGPFLIKFPTQILEGYGKSSSGPSPELARAENARAAFIQEPDSHGSTMSNGVVKFLTSGDSYFARFNHEDGKDIDMTFKTNVMCNMIPVVANPDSAIIDRFRIFPFLATFEDENKMPADLEERKRRYMYKKDLEFENKLEYLAPCFLWYLVTNAYTRYKKEGLSEVPKIIQDYTDKYFEEINIYIKFVDSNIEAVKTRSGSGLDTNKTISKNKVYERFTEWFEKGHYDGKTPNRDMALKNISKVMYGEHQENKFVGWRFKEYDDDDD